MSMEQEGGHTVAREDLVEEENMKSVASESWSEDCGWTSGSNFVEREEEEISYPFLKDMKLSEMAWIETKPSHNYLVMKSIPPSKESEPQFRLPYCEPNRYLYQYLVQHNTSSFHFTQIEADDLVGDIQKSFRSRNDVSCEVVLNGTLPVLLLAKGSNTTYFVLYPSAMLHIQEIGNEALSEFRFGKRVLFGENCFINCFVDGEAREFVLSYHPEVILPMPNMQRQITLTKGEFEDLLLFFNPGGGVYNHVAKLMRNHDIITSIWQELLNRAAKIAEDIRSPSMPDYQLLDDSIRQLTQQENLQFCIKALQETRECVKINYDKLIDHLIFAHNAELFKKSLFTKIYSVDNK